MTRCPTTETPGRIIRFLRDCYEADNHETTLFDLRHEKVEHLQFLGHGGEFLTGTLDRIPVDREAALTAQKTARLYETEKTLVFCALLLTGRLAKVRPPLPQEIFAPLLFFPAQIQDVEESHAFLRVEPREQRVNARVLAALLGDSESASSYVDEILARIPQVPFEPHRIQELIDVFAEFLPDLDTRELVRFHQMDGKVDDLAAHSPRDSSDIRCLPACAVALVPNSPDTRGVLTELARIADLPDRSAPLRALMTAEDGRPVSSNRARPHQIPATLSSAQLKAVQSAAVHPLTLIVGPPGTGKSYTVAALAVDHLLRGQSVLIAAKTNQALDVLADKLKALVGESRFLMRGGRAGYTRQLKDSLAHWLEGPATDLPMDPTYVSGILRLQREARAQSAALCRLEDALGRRAEWEREWGTAMAGPRSKSFLSRWLRSCRLKLTDWQLAQQGLYWDLMGQYQSQLTAHHQTLAGLLCASNACRLQRALDRHRQQLVTLSKALRARTNRRQQDWFAQTDLGFLLQTFPIWMTTLADAGELLPLKPELFDLAIVDEATQCDMASCLPIFFRARRAAIPGDPRQLRHLSFVSRERQRQLAAKWELTDAELEAWNYREKSLLDRVNESLCSQQQVAFLDEHFRSRPRIIAFSNREFYQGALKVMTERPDTLAQPGVVFRPGSGQRSPGGPNREEAERLVAEVAGRVESENDLAPGIAHSLGVLSPFREQVDFLFARLSKRLSLSAIEKHRLRVGTAHSFQGEERDIMFLSFAVDRHAHPASLRFLDRPDVFNVSITRARNLQIVFSSLQPDDLPGSSLLRRYLEAIARPTAETVRPSPPDAFLHEVQETLIARGFKTWPCYVIAGVPVDLLVETGGRSLGLDLIGHPGHLAPAFALEKYRLFQRAGLRLFPLSLSAWRKQQPASLAAIERWISQPV